MVEFATDNYNKWIIQRSENIENTTNVLQIIIGSLNRNKNLKALFCGVHHQTTSVTYE